MQRSKPQTSRKRCTCGRPTAGADTFVYRSLATRFVFRRCQCGAEWTERQDDVDRTQPVTGDEIITVHERLARLEGPFQELFGTS